MHLVENKRGKINMTAEMRLELERILMEQLAINIELKATLNKDIANLC